MDSWLGRDGEPITLNKYLYGNADPINNTDPTGNFSLASFGTATNIRGILTTTSVRSFSGALTQAVGGALRLGGQATSKLALRTLRRCIRKQNKCGLQFNLLIVGYDNRKMVDHIRSAQTARTVVLTYIKNKKGNRQWYRNRGGCKLPGPVGHQCDEYPMWKTRENKASTSTVSLRWVPASENMSVGGHFGFLASRMKTRDEFVVITSDSLPTVALPLGKDK